MKVLNLYAGIGGNRKSWEDVNVTAVEINPEIAEVYKDLFPNDIIVIGDAHQYLLENYDKFDFIWSSPPCQSHSRMIISGTNRKKKVYPDMKLYQEIIFLNQFATGKYLIENVRPYYEPLIKPSQIIGRHYYWNNFKIDYFVDPKMKTDLNNMKKKDLCNYLGFPETIPNIYIDGNHCNIQILRNCVHPETGLHILNCARNIISKLNTKQTQMFT
jgi:DNA (cytosine-5)-methyltransferase 1